MAPVPQGEPIVNDDDASIKSRHINRASDGEAQALVIASLRSQVQDLYSQVTQLNNKLVKSYDRVSDLEDDLHVTSANLRSSSLRISQLELERTQHLSALNTGLLVEKSQVTAELTRVMEKATEEAAQRGQAESARAAIEKDLDDLSASLFNQANTMVAEARYGRSLSEQKVVTAEQALKGAEEAVAVMQQQMQDLRAENESSEKRMQEMQITMGKGKWSERQGNGHLARSTRLLSSHAPYQEFLLFVAHLRSVHPASLQQPPAMTTLLPLPFISRLMTEDSDPTLRLDFAPSLNWLSRRSVLAAINSGQLTIEPMASTTLLQESQSIPGLGNNTVTCALCGAPIFPSFYTPSQTRMTLQNPSTTWSTSLFKRQLNGSATSSPPPSPGHAPLSGKTNTDNFPPQVHIFRVSPSTSNTSTLPSVSVSIPSLPMALSHSASSTSSLPPQPPQHPTTPHHTSSPSQSSSSAIYPLCTSGWCLSRLRATCSLWAFVRSGIVEKVWEEEVPPSPETATSGIIKSEKVAPPTPLRKRSLWGMATAFQERAASWGESDKDKKKVATPPALPPKASAPQPQTREKKLPATVLATPPPVHPSLNINKAPPSTSTSRSSPTTAAPPLPKRNEGRARGNRQSLVVDKLPEESEATVLFAAPHSPHSPTPPTLPTPNNEETSAVPEMSLRIPLPDSRPSTPVAAVASNETSPSIPSIRTTSPGPGIGGRPPLPVRAVARGPRPMRPISRSPTPVAAPNDVEGGKKIGIETETKAVGGGDDDHHQKAEKSVNESETVREVLSTTEEPPMTKANEANASSSVAPAAPPASAGGELERDTDTSAVSGSTSGDTNTNTVEPSVLTSEAVDGVDGVGVAPASKEDGSGEPHEQTNAQLGQMTTTSIQVAAEEVEGKEKVTIETDSATATPVQAEEGKKEKESEKREGTDANTVEAEEKYTYIGDATWEERTWKEVVRLKEVMFWARIGGLKG